MQALSVVIITFNEARNIGRCLESIRDLADEIVVLDSYSTDETETICKTYGVRFYQHTFDGHIEQKNRALTYARHPMVLSLDADEAPDDNLKASILRAKTLSGIDGFTMNRLTYYCGTWIRHCGWYPDVKLRLWLAGKGQWQGTNPHDEYKLPSSSRIVHLNGDLLHYSYYTREDHLRQLDYFTGISARALFEQGKKVGLLKQWMSPVVRFLRDYLFQLGFLDGRAGFQVCRLSAFATWLKYHKLAQLWKST